MSKREGVAKINPTKQRPVHGVHVLPVRVRHLVRGFRPRARVPKDQRVVVPDAAQLARAGGVERHVLHGVRVAFERRLRREARGAVEIAALRADALTVPGRAAPFLPVRAQRSLIVIGNVPQKDVTILPAGRDFETLAVHVERELGVVAVPSQDEIRSRRLQRARDRAELPILASAAVRRVPLRGRARLSVRLRLRVPHEKFRRVRVRDQQVRRRLELAHLVHLPRVDNRLEALHERAARLLFEHHVLRGGDAAFDDLRVGDDEGVWEKRRPVRLLAQVQALLVLVLVRLQDRAPSHGEGRPHEPVVREPVVQERDEVLPSPARGGRGVPTGDRPRVRAGDEAAGGGCAPVGVRVRRHRVARGEIASTRAIRSSALIGASRSAAMTRSQETSLAYPREFCRNFVGKKGAGF
eukprot:30854-Pelagococcus_subviridis.AAC.12